MQLDRSGLRNEDTYNSPSFEMGCVERFMLRKLVLQQGAMDHSIIHARSRKALAEIFSVLPDGDDLEEGWGQRIENTSFCAKARL
jgi:hypothetical protein